VTQLDDVDPIVKRVPMVLVLETSGGMRRQVRTGEGKRRKHLELLNDGLRKFEQRVGHEQPENVNVDAGVVSFGSRVSVDQPIAPVGEWDLPTLESSGHAPLGEAIKRGIDLLEAQKAEYREHGLPYGLPLFGLLTHGRPTGMTEGGPMWTRIQKQLRVGAQDDHFELVASGVGDRAVDTLCELTVPVNNPVLKVVTAEGGYEEFFRLLTELVGSTRLSHSTGVASRLHPGDVKREYNGLHPVE